MATSRPAHVLGDVVNEYEATFGVHAGQKIYVVVVMTTTGKAFADVPAQYVLVGDELEDLYDDEDEETPA